MGLLVVGNVAFDTIATVKFLPKENQATSIIDISMSDGGCAGNVAVIAKKLGLEVSLYASVGKDFGNSAYLTKLRRMGIDLTYFQQVDSLTARSFMFSDGEGNQQIYYYPGASSRLAYVKVDFEKFSNVHFTAGEFSIYERLMKDASAKKCAISFDPGQELFHRPIEDFIFKCLPYVTYLFLNEHEMNHLLKRTNCKSIEDIFFDRMKSIIVSKGKKGATLYFVDGSIEIPAVKVDRIEDPTGAGDAHRAGFLAGIMKGYNEEVACRIGNIVASFIIRGRGAQANLPDWNKVREVYVNVFGEDIK